MAGAVRTGSFCPVFHHLRHSMRFPLENGINISFTTFRRPVTSVRLLTHSYGTIPERGDIGHMLNDHSKRDAYSIERPSPWPLVAGFLALSAILSTLVVAFGS